MVLGKDLNRVGVTNVEFFFREEELSIVTCDEAGVIRIYDYNPIGTDLQLTASSGH